MGYGYKIKMIGPRVGNHYGQQTGQNIKSLELKQAFYGGNIESSIEWVTMAQDLIYGEAILDWARIFATILVIQLWSTHRLSKGYSWGGRGSQNY